MPVRSLMSDTKALVDRSCTTGTPVMLETLKRLSPGCTLYIAAHDPANNVDEVNNRVTPVIKH